MAGSLERVGEKTKDGRNIQKNKNVEGQAVNTRMLLKWNLKNKITWCGVEETFCIHYMSVISWVGEQLLASQECFAACV